MEYEIIEVDYWEQDATLVIDGLRIYFQFDSKVGPTLLQALKFIEDERRQGYPYGKPWQYPHLHKGN